MKTGREVVGTKRTVMEMTVPDKVSLRMSVLAQQREGSLTFLSPALPAHLQPEWCKMRVGREGFTASVGRSSPLPSGAEKSPECADIY